MALRRLRFVMSSLSLSLIWYQARSCCVTTVLYIIYQAGEKTRLFLKVNSCAATPTPPSHSARHSTAAHQLDQLGFTFRSTAGVRITKRLRHAHIRTINCARLTLSPRENAIPPPTFHPPDAVVLLEAPDVWRMFWCVWCDISISVVRSYLSDYPVSNSYIESPSFSGIVRALSCASRWPSQVKRYA